jgi:putative membrane protein
MFAWLAGRSNREFALFDLTVVGFLIAMTGGRTLLHFATLRYRVTHQGLEIRSGLLNRQHRILPPERIHNVERVQGPLHRVFGLVEVRIETASGDEVEGMLSALSVEQAVTLMTALKGNDADSEHTEPAAPLRVLHRTPVRDLLMYGISSTRLGAIAIVLGFTLEAMQWSDPERIEEVGRMFDGIGMVFLVVAIVSGTWLFGVVNSLIRHWNVRLVQDSNRLITEEGLLTRRRSELPQEKI